MVWHNLFRKMYKITGLQSVSIQYRWIFALCLFIPCVYGADDNESWTSIGFEKKLTRILKIEFDQEIRLDKQLSTFKQTFSEISFSYKLSDGFTLQLPYRYSVYEDKIKQRFGIGCSYKYSFKLISLKYRTKFQRTYEKQEDTEDLLRNKFTIEYKLDNNLKPYISSELIHPYDEASLKLNEFRVSFGLSVSLTKKNSIKLFYIFKQEDITKLDYDKINIFGLSYNYKM